MASADAFVSSIIALPSGIVKVSFWKGSDAFYSESASAGAAERAAAGENVRAKDIAEKVAAKKAA